MIKRHQYNGSFDQMAKCNYNNAPLLYTLRWVWILAVMLSVGLPSVAQRADMGFFNRIRLHTDINIRCKASNDSIGWISYDGLGCGNDAVVAVVNNDVMTIYHKEVAKEELPDTVYVFFPQLVSVANAYNATLAIDSLCTENKFKAELQGNGQITIGNLHAKEAELTVLTGNGIITVKQGNCNKIKARIVGTGQINMSGLISDETMLRCFGTGSIDCPQAQNIKIRGLGTTKIYYTGNPKIKRKGNARIIKVDD